MITCLIGLTQEEVYRIRRSIAVMIEYGYNREENIISFSILKVYSSDKNDPISVSVKSNVV